MQLQVWALMYHPRAPALSEALFAATDALKKKEPKAKRQRGRRPTPDWATSVTVTARLLELCCGMDEATAKKSAANRWGRNLRSVQRYVKEHKENIAEALELIWLVPDMNLQEFAHRYRLQDNEVQQFISYFSGPPKPPPEWGISEAGDAQSRCATGRDN